MGGGSDLEGGPTLLEGVCQNWLPIKVLCFTSSPCPKTSCIILVSILHQAKLVEMWRTQVREDESKIEAEKRIKYKGTARIRLKWLHFQWNRPRELDDKNVERLKADFRKDCRRLDEHNHIPAVIDQQSLDAAEELSGTPAWRMGKYPQGGYPELVFPAGYRVECLHGRHRIQAAKELRLEWWTVDLYLAGRLILFTSIIMILTDAWNRR